MAKKKKRKKGDVSALLSDDVVVKKVRNQTVFSKPTYPKESKSLKKKASIQNFAEAASWAKRYLRKPGMKELYSKRITVKLNNAQTVAVTDYLNAPKIHYVSLKKYTGLVGDKIRIKATDDFQVVAVEVTIADEHGKHIEAGSAIQYKRKPQMWIYTITVSNPSIKGTTIEVKAKDRPENKAVMQVVY